MIERTILAGLLALSGFSSQAQDSISTHGISLCVNEEKVTQVHTDGCGVYEGGGWKRYDWVDYIKLKYPDKTDYDINVTRLEVDASGNLLVVIYYNQSIPEKLNY